MTGRFRGALTALAMLSALPMLGCGYALVGKSSSLPEDVRTGYVRPLENITRRSQVEQILTTAITEALVTRQRLEVVSRAEDADVEVSGTVTGFFAWPVGVGGTGRATEYEVIITAKILFSRLGVSEPVVLWSSDRFKFRQSYPLDVSETDFFDREILAIEEVSEDFAQTLVTDLLEGF